jgi:hypothetical protein
MVAGISQFFEQWHAFQYHRVSRERNGPEAVDVMT